MKSYATYACEGHIALQQLINRMIASLNAFQEEANTVVNEIPSGFFIGESKSGTYDVMEQLLRAVIFNARNGDIHINAEKFSDTIILEIEDRNNYNGYALAARLQGIEPAARKLGGDVYIKGQQKLVATVSFCFPAA